MDNTENAIINSADNVDTVDLNNNQYDMTNEYNKELDNN